MITRQDIIDGYRLFYGEEPRSDRVIRKKMAEWETRSKMIHEIMRSRRFSSRYRRRKLQSTPVTEEIVRLAFKLILRRDPEGDEAVQRKLKNAPSQWHLIDDVMLSQEFYKGEHFRQFTRSSGFNAVPKVIHLHIPKTAGMSFEQLARENYGAQCSLHTNRNIDWGIWESARLIGGHFVYSAYENMYGHRLFVCLIRDPVERSISRFNYYCHQIGDRAVRESKGFNHEDMKKTLTQSGFRTEFLNNYQCYYLSGRHDFSSVQKSFENDAFIVGHYAQMESWLACLGERLGWKDTELPRVNVAQNPGYMERYKEDKELISLLQNGNVDDYRLFDLVQQHGVYESRGPDFDYSIFRAP